MPAAAEPSTRGTQPLVQLRPPAPASARGQKGGEADEKGEVPPDERIGALGGVDDTAAARAAFREAFAASAGWSITELASFSSWASYIGDPELAVDSMRRTFALTPRYLLIVWTPVWEPTRAHPAFKAFMVELGLPEYWRRTGWPEHCRPLGAQDFECG